MKATIKEYIEIWKEKRIKNIKNRKINTLENKIEELECIIKDHLYDEFINYANYKYLVESLTIENKKLNERIKKLKKELNEK